MQTIKEIFSYLDCLFIPLWGYSMIETLMLFVTGSFFSTSNSVISLLLAVTGLVYFFIRIYYYTKKQSISVMMDKENLRKMQIENNKADLNNYLFAQNMNEIPDEESIKNRKQLK